MTEKIEWRCIRQPLYYLIVCRVGVIELCDTLEADLWHRTIDRCLMLRRVVRRLQSNMVNVIEVMKQEGEAK
jgi:hypothetical protein